jgi:hypothetical protein
MKTQTQVSESFVEDNITTVIKKAGFINNMPLVYTLALQTWRTVSR